MEKGKTSHSDQFTQIKAIVSPELHHFINEHHITWALMDEVREDNSKEIYYKALEHISVEISNHFKFEEEIILPKLQKYISLTEVGPINKLIAEHISINNKYQEVIKSLAGNNLNDDVKNQVKLLAYLVKKHIEKEDHFFFPMISLILNQSEKDEIKRELDGVEKLQN